MTYLFTLTLLTSVGVLLGSIIFLSLVLAPTVFQTLDVQAESRLLHNLFPRYYRLGLICCGLALGPAITGRRCASTRFTGGRYLKRVKPRRGARRFRPGGYFRGLIARNFS